MRGRQQYFLCLLPTSTLTAEARHADYDHGVVSHQRIVREGQRCEPGQAGEGAGLQGDAASHTAGHGLVGGKDQDVLAQLQAGEVLQLGQRVDSSEVLQHAGQEGSKAAGSWSIANNQWSCFSGRRRGGKGSA